MLCSWGESDGGAESGWGGGCHKLILLAITDRNVYFVAVIAGLLCVDEGGEVPGHNAMGYINKYYQPHLVHLPPIFQI